MRRHARRPRRRATAARPSGCQARPLCREREEDEHGRRCRLIGRHGEQGGDGSGRAAGPNIAARRSGSATPARCSRRTRRAPHSRGSSACQTAPPTSSTWQNFAMRGGRAADRALDGVLRGDASEGRAGTAVARSGTQHQLIQASPKPCDARLRARRPRLASDPMPARKRSWGPIHPVLWRHSRPPRARCSSSWLTCWSPATARSSSPKHSPPTSGNAVVGVVLVATPDEFSAALERLCRQTGIRITLEGDLVYLARVQLKGLGSRNAARQPRDGCATSSWNARATWSVNGFTRYDSAGRSAVDRLDRHAGTSLVAERGQRRLVDRDARRVERLPALRLARQVGGDVTLPASSGVVRWLTVRRWRARSAAARLLRTAAAVVAGGWSAPRRAALVHGEHRHCRGDDCVARRHHALH